MTDEIVRGTGGSLAGEVSDVKRDAHVLTDAATPFSNTTNPAVTDDATKGYVAGMRWINTTTDSLFTLVEAAEGAAVWIETVASSVEPPEFDVTNSLVIPVSNTANTLICTLYLPAGTITIANSEMWMGSLLAADTVTVELVRKTGPAIVGTWTSVNTAPNTVTLTGDATLPAADAYELRFRSAADLDTIVFEGAHFTVT